MLSCLPSKVSLHGELLSFSTFISQLISCPQRIPRALQAKNLHPNNKNIYTQSNNKNKTAPMKTIWIQWGKADSSVCAFYHTWIFYLSSNFIALEHLHWEKTKHYLLAVKSHHSPAAKPHLWRWCSTANMQQAPVLLTSLLEIISG